MKYYLGAITARMLLPYAKSQHEAVVYARYINFFSLFVCLLAGIMNVPAECSNMAQQGYGRAPTGARISFSTHSSSLLQP